MATPLPLDGIRVLDCSRVLAGPFATMLLADLGADVIKVEPPDGDETRTWGPPFWGPPADGLSAYFTSVNRNKRSIVLDLKTDAGRATLDGLARRADLLVHNYRPATAQRLGLDAERMAALNDRLVVASVGGFAGDDPALRNRPAYDLLAQAMTGIMSITGEPNGEPHKVGVAMLDLVAGLEVAVGALAALVGRGRARSVEVSLIESGTTALVNVLGNHLATGVAPGRHGNLHPNIAPYEPFATADGHIVVAVGNDAQFGRLLRTLDLTDADARFATNADRLRHHAELTAWLGRAISRRPRDELVEELTDADVPAGPVRSVGESVTSLEEAHVDGWVAETGGMRLAPSPLRVDGVRAPIRRPPPRLGQHTDEILTELSQ
ncbi:MAG: CaiB/BaiF CoA transferase family protein [Thermoleophilaceae bacterium]